MAQAITRTTICAKMLPSCGAAMRHAFVTKPRIVKRMHSKQAGVGLALLALLAVLVASIGVLHTNSAPLVRTLAVGSHPVRVIVSTRTGRAFALNGGTSAGTISMLDTRTGTLIHTLIVGADPSSLGSAVVVPQTARLFFIKDHTPSGGPGTVTMFDAHSGRFLRAVPVGYLPEAAVVDEQSGRVFVLNQNNALGQKHATISVLDAESGQVVGHIAVGQNFNQQPNAHALAIDGRHNRILASVASTENGAALDIVDAKSGALVQSRATGQFAESIVADEQTGHAFVMGGAGISMFATTSGKLLHYAAVGRFLNVRDAVVNRRTGQLFVLSWDWNNGGTIGNSGHVFIVDMRKGALLRTLVVSWPTSMAVDELTGHVLITSSGPQDANGTLAGSGSLGVFDGLTGAVLQAIPVGVSPESVSVDTRTRHALVANYGGTVRVTDRWAWIPKGLRHWLPFLTSAPTRNDPGSISMLTLAR